MTKQYRVHIAYINTHGALVPEGIYGETEFDLAEARHKSIVTAFDVDIHFKEIEDSTVKVQKFNQHSSSFNLVDLQTKLTTKVPVLLQINSCKLEDLVKVKYVSKKAAEDVVKLRQEQRFSNYVDLNRRVPLKFGRVWEDIVPIDFEPMNEINNDNTIRFSDGINPAL